MNSSSRKSVASIGVVSLVMLSFMGVVVVPPASGTASTAAGVIIPLYSYPTDSSWATVIQARQAYPNVPFLVVINPGNGPGSAADPNYATGINKMQAAGIQVLGYVYTSYGSRSISSIEADINSYNGWYHANGIFFDEMSNVAGGETYYSTLSSYAHGLGMSTAVGNPGAPVPTSYVGTANSLCIYENSGTPSISSLSYPGYGPSNFCVIAYGVPMSASFLSQAASSASWLYVTDAAGADPYSVLPTYFLSEVATLSAIDSVTSTASTSATSSTATTSGTCPSTVTGGTPLLPSNPWLFGNAISGGISVIQCNFATAQGAMAAANAYYPPGTSYLLGGPYGASTTYGSYVEVASGTASTTSTTSSTTTITTTTTPPSTTTTSSTSTTTTTQSTTSATGGGCPSTVAGSTPLSPSNPWLFGNPIPGGIAVVQCNFSTGQAAEAAANKYYPPGTSYLLGGPYGASTTYGLYGETSTTGTTTSTTSTTSTISSTTSTPPTTTKTTSTYTTTTTQSTSATSSTDTTSGACPSTVTGGTPLPASNPWVFGNPILGGIAVVQCNFSTGQAAMNAASAYYPSGTPYLLGGTYGSSNTYGIYGEVSST